MGLFKDDDGKGYLLTEDVRDPPFPSCFHLPLTRILSSTPCIFYMFRNCRLIPISGDTVFVSSRSQTTSSSPRLTFTHGRSRAATASRHLR
jgi:hypothetical protein